MIKVIGRGSVGISVSMRLHGLKIPCQLVSSEDAIQDYKDERLIVYTSAISSNHQARWFDDDDLVKVNVTDPIKCVDHYAKHGIPVILCSTAAVYQQSELSDGEYHHEVTEDWAVTPHSPYTKSKLLLEAVAITRETALVLRIPTFLGVKFCSNSFFTRQSKWASVEDINMTFLSTSDLTDALVTLADDATPLQKLHASGLMGLNMGSETHHLPSFISGRYRNELKIVPNQSLSLSPIVPVNFTLARELGLLPKEPRMEADYE